jgi:general secretion pathway protein D
VPGLGDLPVAGRLFTHTRDTSGKTEIVLLITPRLMRTLARPAAGSVEFAAGTEASTGGRAATIPVPQIFVPQPPAAQPPAAQPPAARPPAARPPAAGEPAQPQAPTGQPMVPFGGVRPPGQ